MSSEIRKIIKKGENESTEFRGTRTHIETLANSICGMLNQQGGAILWGVDNDGDIGGVNDADDRINELHAYVADRLSPAPLFSASAHQVSGETIVMIDVPQGADKPYSLEREIFVRIGRATLKADTDASASLVQKSASQLDRWEYEPLPGFEISNCDQSELKEARKQIVEVGRLGTNVPGDDEGLLRKLHLTRSGQFTNAAVVLFASDPLAWAPNLAVRIVSFSSGKTGSIANDVLLTGPAVRTLHEAVTIIQQRTGYSGRFDSADIERVDLPAYAPFALREGLVNAVVHRDYSVVGGHVRVEIYPDHLTIENPGRLPEGWKPADLKKKHGSVPGNPDIARAFYLRKLMEQLGIGTQKLVDECRELGAKPPDWNDDQNMLSLTLYPAPEPQVRVRLSQRQKVFLENTKFGGEYKTSDYAMITGVVVRQAQRELAELLEFGFVERRGKGRATAYVRTEKSP